MIEFLSGFFIALAVIFILSGLMQRFMLKKGWYASATWDDKNKVWKVRGRYLSISTKILRGVREELGSDKVKYVDI